MFCNKCGNQVPDGMNFCNNCGNSMAPTAPAQPQQPVAPQQPMYQQPPMQQPEPPKKKNTGLIVGITVGVIGILVAVFCILAFVAPGFLIEKDKGDNKDDEKDSAITSAVADANNNNNNGGNNNQQQNTPVANYNIDDAEDVALEYMKSYFDVNFRDCFDCEITGWEFFENICEPYFLKSYQEEVHPGATLDEMYSELSSELGYTVTGIEEIYDYVRRENNAFADYTFDVIAESKQEISKNEAQPYIDGIKDQIDDFSDYGANSNDIEWDKIEAYAEVVLVNNAEPDSDSVPVILGYLNGDWKIIALAPEHEITLWSFQLLSFF